MIRVEAIAGEEFTAIAFSLEDRDPLLETVGLRVCGREVSMVMVTPPICESASRIITGAGRYFARSSGPSRDRGQGLNGAERRMRLPTTPESDWFAIAIASTTWRKKFTVTPAVELLTRDRRQWAPTRPTH